MPAENPHAHIWALDNIMAINSRMAFVAVIGVGFALPDAKSVAGESACDPTLQLSRRFLVYEAVTIAFTLLSMYLAGVLKVIVNLFDAKDAKDAKEALDAGRPPPRVDNRTVLRWFMVWNAAFTAVAGIFLMLSLVNLFQFRLGMISCGSIEALQVATIFYGILSPCILLKFCVDVITFLRR